MKQLSLAVLLFLLSLIGFGQDEVQRGTSAWFLQLAIDQMSQLKSGALLVRLPENEIAIKAALEREMPQRAKAIQEELDLKNYEVVKAFQHQYNFSEVYFFKASDTQFVLNQRWDSITYYNFDLEPTPIMTFRGSKPYLTAEMTFLRADTTFANEKGNGDDPMFEAIIIKSTEFVQLHKPFPFYVRTWGSLPFKRKTTRVVDMLNEHLWDFYNQFVTKKE